MIASLELSKNGKEVNKDTIWKIKEEISLQKKQHLFSTETSKDVLKTIEMKLSVRETELNHITSKCLKMKEIWMEGTIRL